MNSVKPAFKISPDFFKDLTWLIEKCDSSDEITLSDKGKYKYVIFYLKQIVATFLFIRKHDHEDDILEQHIPPNYVPFFKNPEFLFDDYIYHTPRNDSNKKKYLEKCKYPKYVDDEVKRTESPSMGAVGSKPDTPTGCLGDSKRFLDSTPRISCGNPVLNDRRSPEKFDIGFPSEILDKECVVKYYTHFIMDTTNYNTITDFKLIPYRPPPTSLPSPETNSVIQGYAPKNDNTTNISTGGNDPTQTKSQKLSQITSNSSKQASTIPYTDGELLKNLSILGSISSSIQIQFNYFTSSFTTFTIVATPIASILSGPSAVTQNIPISDITGSTDITKNQHIYSITGLSQGTQYKLSLSATDYFKRTTTLVNQYATKQPPDPPTNLQIVSLTDYTADITFTPPIQIIDTYFANVYSGSRFVFSERFDVPKGAEGKRVKLPLTVSGLNFNVYYTVTFFAINSDGLSQGSVPITFLTPQIPDAPTNLFSTSQTSISIDLSFNPPLQYVQYYTFVAFDASNIQVFNQDINSQSNKYSVTGLMPNKIYDIHVYSNNSDGISPTYIQLIAETLPTLT